jgi:hypothetical protein
LRRTYFCLKKDPRRRGNGGREMITLRSNNIVTECSSGVKIAVLAPTGKWASPYSIEGRVLIKRVAERHIFRARQAVGIDEAIWQEHKDRVDIVKFIWWDGRIFEIPAGEFECKSFLHGDGITFAKTRFVSLKELRLVRERPPMRGQLTLFAGVGS